MTSARLPVTSCPFHQRHYRDEYAVITGRFFSTRSDAIARCHACSHAARLADTHTRHYFHRFSDTALIARHDFAAFAAIISAATLIAAIPCRLTTPPLLRAGAL